MPVTFHVYVPVCFLPKIITYRTMYHVLCRVWKYTVMIKKRDGAQICGVIDCLPVRLHVTCQIALESPVLDSEEETHVLKHEIRQ